MTQYLRDLTPDAVQKILGRAALDQTFRTQLANDPATVLAVLGFKGADAAISFFKALAANPFNSSADELAKSFSTDPLPNNWF
jgi:hypothetical protein